jgi:uncharacterized protein (TIGR02453 family)
MLRGAGMGYFDEQTFSFLRELKRNNDRAWFNANKERYEESVKEPFLRFIEDVGPELRKVSRNLVADPRPVGGSLFRIYRDIRFSKDKSPYKTHVGAHFPLGKGMAAPGYYLHLEPDECFVAGGMWMPEPPSLQKIRERIAERPADWKKARGDLDRDEGSLKRAPRGFDPEHPMVEDLKRKSLTASVPLSDAQMKRADLTKTFVKSCERISPLMKFLASSVGAKW